MAYPIEVKIAPKASWFTPVESKAYYGSYARQGVTVHWWGGGEGASSHDAIVNYFMAQGAKGIKSVNYVVSDIKITKMVEPQNVAFCSQSGNPVTISIEFQPTLTDEGYKRGGWLISELEKQFGPQQLYKHSFWFPTSCPGTIDLNRLRAEANKGDDMLNYDQVDSMAHAYLNDSIANNPGLKQYVGKPAGEVIAAFNGAPQRAAYLKYISDLEKDGTVLKPGKYIVVK